jgi:hypothetical protein
LKVPSRFSIILLVTAIWILWAFGFQTMWKFFVTEIDGVIIVSQDHPSKGASRYGTEYLVRSADGKEKRYVAGATDASLERSLPVGTHIHKVWGQFGYEINDRWISFPLAVYSAMMGIALFCIVWAVVRWREE